MSLSRQPVIFVQYVNAAWTGDAGAPFHEKLRAYQNRPFDDMKKVLDTKMQPADKEAFIAHWDAQVEDLKAFEATLSIRYPLDQDTLLRVLPLLEGKLNELVSRLTVELTEKLQKEATYDAATKGYVETMARACAFHLLTKSKLDIVKTDPASFKKYQEFYRLLRKSIFRDDVINHFASELAKVFDDKSSFNETKVDFYSSIFGDMTEKAYFHGVQHNASQLAAMELDAILKTLYLIQNETIKDAIKKIVEDLWEEKWNQYARENISNTNVSVASNLFMVLDDKNYQLGDLVQRNILLQLCKLAFEGKFDEKSEGDSVYQFRDAFIKKIVDSLANVKPDLRDEVMGELKTRFHDFKDKKIQTAIGTAPSKGIKGLFSSAATVAAAAAAATVNTVSSSSSSSSSKKKDGPSKK